MKTKSKWIILISIFAMVSCKDNQKQYEQIDKMQSPDQDAIVNNGKTMPTKFSPTIDSIVEDYLKIKNALVNDDPKQTTVAAKVLLETFNKVNTDSIDSKLQNQYTDIVNEAKIHLENIGANPENLNIQRMNFSELSGDINNLIMIFGTNKKLYQDYCPMYNKGTTGFWISELKDIKNPYYGSEMLTCGMIKKEF